MAKIHDGDQGHHGDQPERKQARQCAAEIVLRMPDLTDELADAAARPLLAWGVIQAEAAAGEPEPGQGMDAPRDVELLAERIAPVRRIIKVVNSLAADRRTLEPAQVAEELALVLDLADRLPWPPTLQACAVRSSVVADLAAWQTEMNDQTFVRSVLALLQGPVAGSGNGPTVQAAGPVVE